MKNGDERILAAWTLVVEKLKEVVHELKITQDELHVAGDYLNRAGQAGVCRSLLDVALAMTSIDATVLTKDGTRPNLEGPYHDKHPVRANGSLLDHDPAATAIPLTLSGTVTVGGKPVAGAHVDFWQADDEGHYDLGGTHLRGIVVTDENGRYEVRTIVPCDYSDHDNDPIGELFQAMGRHNRRAAHIHAKIGIGGEVRLTTQIFIPCGAYIDSDYVEGAVSADLIIDMETVSPDPQGGYQAHFDFHLPETVGTRGA